MIKIIFLDIDSYSFSKKDIKILNDLKNYGINIIFLSKNTFNEIKEEIGKIDLLKNLSLSICENGAIIHRSEDGLDLSFENIRKEDIKEISLDLTNSLFYKVDNTYEYKDLKDYKNILQIRVSGNEDILDKTKFSIEEDDEFIYLLNPNRSRIKAIKEILNFYEIEDNESLFILKDKIDKDIVDRYDQVTSLNEGNEYIKKHSLYVSKKKNDQIYGILSKILF